MKMKSLCGTILAAAIAPSDIVAKSVAVAEDAVPDAYRAQWNDKVNAEIDARIEKWRKADGVFQVGEGQGAVHGIPPSRARSDPGLLRGERNLSPRACDDLSAVSSCMDDKRRGCRCSR